MRSRVLFAVVLVLIGCGCVRIPRDRIEVHRYSIDPPPPPPKVEEIAGLTLLVAPFQTGAQQKGERMMFRSDPHGMDYYYYHRWIVPPAKMLGDVLATHLLEWGLVGDRVVQSEIGVVPTHEVHGRLTTFYANNMKGSYAAEVEISVTLLRIVPKPYRKEMVFQQTYSIQQPRENWKVETYVEAVNGAVEEWLERLRTDLAPVLAAEAGTADG